MAAKAHDRAVLQNHNLAGIVNGAYTLGDHELRRVRELGREGMAKCRVGLEVERGERVVEDVEVSVTYEGARNGEALALATGEVRAALGHGGVEAAGKLADEARLRDVERVPELLVRRVGAAMAEVLGDGAAEEPRLLRDIGDAIPELRLGDIADVDALEEELAAGDVVLPEPVLPMMAVTSPRRMLNVRSFRVFSSASEKRRHT